MGLFSKKKTETKSRFAEIDSIEKAELEVQKGGLERLYIVSPSLFGGSEDIDNVLFVPVGVAAQKEELDVRIADLMREGHQCGFDCRPEYRDKSVVPSKITLSYRCDGNPYITVTIKIW